MKKLFFFFAIVLTIQLSAQQYVNVRETWNAVPDALGYIIVNWEGVQESACPFIDNMDFEDLDLTGLSVDTLSAGNQVLIFQTQLNGERIRAAGFVLFDFGITSTARLSPFVKKPAVMRLDYLNIEIYK